MDKADKVYRAFIQKVSEYIETNNTTATTLARDAGVRPATLLKILKDQESQIYTITALKISIHTNIPIITKKDFVEEDEIVFIPPTPTYNQMSTVRW